MSSAAFRDETPTATPNTEATGGTEVYTITDPIPTSVAEAAHRAYVADLHYAALLAARAGAFRFSPGCWSRVMGFHYTSTSKAVPLSTSEALYELWRLGLIQIHPHDGSRPRYCDVTAGFVS